MPLVAAAVCPHPPLLVPEMAARAASELDDLRSACHEAIDSVRSAKPDEVIVVGGNDVRRDFGPSSVGTLTPYGGSISVTLDGSPPAETPSLPLSLTIGAWLLASGAPGPLRRGVGVAAGMFAADCARLGVALTSGSARVGLLIMGDGSACRGDKSPGYGDPRAEAFDASVARALADADVDGLLGLDATVAAELLVAGRASWQVLAGAATGDWHGRVLYDAAPYGVSYQVATWRPAA